MSENTVSHLDASTDSTIASSTNTNTNQHHTAERYESLERFVKSAFINHDIRIESLAGDASFRRYHRVYLGEPIDTTITPQKYDATYIVMDAPPQLESIESFVRVNLLLEMRANVPTLFAKDINQGFLLMQDFGDTEFAHLLSDAQRAKEGAKIDSLYHWAMDTLINIQGIKPDLAQHAFHIEHYDDVMLTREMNLFSEWFLPYIGVTFDTQTTEIWQAFKQGVVEEVINQPQLVVHRDYHSRNLMQDQYNKDVLGVIDFQDAVIGSYTYDLVSLVRDAYVEWNEVKVNRWIKYFWQRQIDNKAITDSITLHQFTTDVNITGVQRHLKVLGIFVRLAQRDGKLRYLQDIPKVWNDLLIELEWLSNQGSAKIASLIEPMYTWLKTDIEPQFKETFIIDTTD